MKSCPFCGNTNIFVGTIDQVDGASDVVSSNYNDTHYQAVCDYTRGGCGAVTGGYYTTASAAEKAWNTRKI